MEPPPEMEGADVYYVVSIGRKVGIFTNKYVAPLLIQTLLTCVPSVLSTRAISGVPGGHQLAEKSWFSAATLYNSLWDGGYIKRVRA